MTTYFINPEDIKDGTIEHIDIGDSTTVNCKNCWYLTKLPLWPNVTHVICSGCVGLTELPLWPKIIRLDANHCTNLTELPLWSEVATVYCNWCVNLTELPIWPNITNVYSTGCNITYSNYLRLLAQQYINKSIQFMS